MKCGLLGRKLSHSYSPQIHACLADYSYDLIELEPQELSDFFSSCDYDGLNVTIPYKKDVIPYCACLSPVAQAMGAVNTIVRLPDGGLMGHNTDYYGFSETLSSAGLTVSGKKALVLGSGGASNTAVKVLQALGAKVIVISRSGENHYGNLHLHSDASLIVNATPVGMYPNPGVSPVALSAFPRLEGVLDMIYNPARTKLLMDAVQRGLIAVNGLLMLVAQAKESAEWFTGKKISDEKIGSILNALQNQMENIVLIGMPGCGKSTVGKALADKMGRKFVDADVYLAEKAGRSIPEIFASGGEAEFRRLETQVLQELGMQSSLVIATGGGCVTREENYPLLHQNGKIIWLQRDLDQLPTNGRPLSQATSLSQMYSIRKPLYHRFADHCVENSKNVDHTVGQILQILEG